MQNRKVNVTNDSKTLMEEIKTRWNKRGLRPLRMVLNKLGPRRSSCNKTQKGKLWHSIEVSLSELNLRKPL